MIILCGFFVHSTHVHDQVMLVFGLGCLLLALALETDVNLEYNLLSDIFV